jgi:formamidopyrimidine-DNA glycosylase
VAELPGIESHRRYLARHAEGRRISRVTVLDPEIVRNRRSQSLGRALKQERFALPERHGKWLIAPVGDVWLLIHFGMTGDLLWATDAADRQPRDRVIFVCDGGELRYNNMRRFGGIWLARDETELARVTGPLGPDAARLERGLFTEILSRRRGGAKAALMDQSLVAGLGNMLSDEILWRGRVNPSARVDKLSPIRRDRLYDALHVTVGESMRHRGIPRGKGWLTGVREDRPGGVRDAERPCGTARSRGERHAGALAASDGERGPPTA